METETAETRKICRKIRMAEEKVWDGEDGGG